MYSNGQPQSSLKIYCCTVFVRYWIKNSFYEHIKCEMQLGRIFFRTYKALQKELNEAQN